MTSEEEMVLALNEERQQRIREARSQGKSQERLLQIDQQYLELIKIFLDRVPAKEKQREFPEIKRRRQPNHWRKRQPDRVN